MAKKKKSKKVKKQRRKEEIIKAHLKSGMKDSFLEKLVDEDVVDTTPRKITHRLHLKEIKTDLIKTAIFVVFAIILLYLIKSQGLQLNLGINK